jgi:release factor glutamine methyltransferase
MTALRGVSVADALDSALVALNAADVDSPRLDAELLLAHALRVDRAQLAMHPERELEPGAAREFRELVRRRAFEREPLAYITGRKAFRHLELDVDPRVLIPRPETELLVEVGLTLPAGTHVHDLGTGSGAIALAVKHERPDLVVSGSDASRDAISVAIANARRLELDVLFTIADWAKIPPRTNAVLCNPPYVAEPDRARLAPELRHEPSEALFAGEDGLDAIRTIVQRVVRTPARRPFLIALEVGAGQAPAVESMLRAAGLEQTAIRRDLAGIERAVIGWRS